MPRCYAFEARAVDDAAAQITLRVQSTQTSAPCPLCATVLRNNSILTPLDEIARSCDNKGEHDACHRGML
jgi:hypothetical protein